MWQRWVNGGLGSTAIILIPGQSEAKLLQGKYELRVETSLYLHLNGGLFDDQLVFIAIGIADHQAF